MRPLRSACQLLTALAVPALAAAALPAQSPASRAALAASLDSLAASAFAKNHLPAMSVAIIKGRDTLLMKGYGLADLENEVPATAQTVYRIGSITKQFTSATVLRLAERGKLSLGDTITKFLTGFPLQGNVVTVRQLLNHTSGIPSYTGLGPRWSRTMRQDVPPDSLVALVSGLPFDFPPGTQWRYNNSGYVMLGMIIEKVTGQPYGSYLRDSLLAPLGLTSTTYCDQRPLIKHRAQGYEPADNGGFVNAQPLSMTQPFAAGALCSTVGDLAAWTRALFDGRVVNPMSLAAMTTPDKLADGKPLQYGFGLGVATLDGHRAIEHGGGINGFITFLSYLPDDTLTVVVLTNSGAANPDAIARRLARRALGIAEPRPKDLALGAAELANFAGNYAQGTVRIAVVARSGGLYLDGPGLGGRLLYQGGGMFVFENDPDMRVALVPSTSRANQLLITAAGSAIFRGARVP